MSLFSCVFNAGSGASSGVVYGVNWNPTTDTYERTGIAAGPPRGYRHGLRTTLYGYAGQNIELRY